MISATQSYAMEATETDTLDRYMKHTCRSPHNFVISDTDCVITLRGTDSFLRSTLVSVEFCLSTPIKRRAIRLAEISWLNNDICRGLRSVTVFVHDGYRATKLRLHNNFTVLCNTGTSIGIGYWYWVLGIGIGGRISKIPQIQIGERAWGKLDWRAIQPRKMRSSSQFSSPIRKIPNPGLYIHKPWEQTAKHAKPIYTFE